MPSPISTDNDALGIFQGDVIVRTAIMAGLQDLRANPFLLDYCFASLGYDALTAREYGQTQIKMAKDWFLSTQVQVFMDFRLGDFSSNMPCVTISMISSAEAETTLADTHYAPVEVVAGINPILAGPFTATNYNAATGILTIPPTVSQFLILGTNMVVTDKTGRQFAIQAVLSDTTLQLAPNLTADFTKATLNSGSPGYVRAMESVQMRESYSLGCHVSGEPSYLIYLHSVIIFILLRYKQTLLEGRGFERSQISSSDFSRDERFQVENCYSRFISLQGSVRQYWPKVFSPTIQTVATQIVVEGLPNMQLDPNSTLTASQQVADSLIIGEMDSLSDLSGMFKPLPNLPIPAPTYVLGDYPTLNRLPTDEVVVSEPDSTP